MKKLVHIYLFLLLFSAVGVQGQYITALDNAGNYTAWTHGSNLGFGFGPWNLYVSGGAGGTFLGSSHAGLINTDVRAFGMWGNPGWSHAERMFTHPLNVGQTFTIELSVHWRDGGRGIDILNAAVGNIFNFNITNAGYGATGWGWLDNSAIRLSITQTAANAFTVSALRLNDNETWSSGALTGVVAGFRAYVGATGGGDERNFFINNLRIETADPAAVPATANVQIRGAVELAATATLTVNNLTIPTGNSFTIKSTAAGTGSLIHNTAGVAATMERFFAGSAHWRLVSSPVANQAISGPWTPATPGYDFYAWDEPASTWRNQKVPANNLNNFVPGRGYLVSFQGTDLTQSFAGALNNGDITVPVTRLHTGAFRGANLLGNPYPSSIDWNQAVRTLFVDDFAYIYNPLAGGGGGAYEPVNGATAGALIAPNQGFFVIKAATGTASFTFTNVMRTHGGVFRSAPADPTISITLKQGEFYDRAQIVQLPDATTARERSDALKFFSYNPMMPQVFSMSSDAVQLAVNSTGPITEDASFTIGVLTPVTGTYTLQVEGLQEMLAGRPAFLLDKVTGTPHNLREQSRISFNAVQSNTTVERFVLSFVQPTGVVNLPEDATVIYFANGMLYMQFAAEDRNRQLQVIDLSGRVVLSKSLHGMGSVVSVPLQIDNGAYIVRITGETSAVNRRILVR